MRAAEPERRCLALGHPVGASGARLVGTAALVGRRGGRYASPPSAAAWASAATILERV
jgi:acetyl-CoA acetyltransferase